MKRSPLRRKPESPAVRAFRVAVRARARGVCEAQTSVCWGVVDPLMIEAHHIGGRVGADAHNPDTNGLGCCPPCHRYIESHREESYERGWLRHRNYGSDGAVG